MRLDMRVTGDAELRRGLTKLVLAAQPAAVREALTAASEPVIEAAKARAPTNTVSRGIQVVRVFRRTGGEIVAEVGLPGGRKPWFYGLFFELGTGPRFHKSGKRTGSMPARPFLRPAFAAQKKNASRIFFDALRRLMPGGGRG